MRLPIAAALLTLVACSRTTEGPIPKVTETTNPRQRFVHPARVCNAQGPERGWRIELTGERFTPMPLDVLTDAPKVGMPTVTLKGAESYTLPRENVFRESAELLLLDVPTENSATPKKLAPGSYAVEVKNPSGGTGELADALVVVPPPTLASITAPQGFNASAPSPIVITGSGFQTGTSPQLTLRRAGAPDQSIFTFTVVSETRIEGELPPGTAEGTYDLVIINPEGCAFTLPSAITIAYARLGTLTVDPRFGWVRRDQPITLYNVASGEQKVFSGGSPEVTLLAPLKADATQQVEIPLMRVAYVSPSVITAVVPTCTGNALVPATDPACPTGIAEGGPYRLRVVDPNGAVGEVPVERGFTVVRDEPPTITALNPSAINTQGLTAPANPLVVTGRNFGVDAAQNRQPKVQLLQKLANENIRACDLPLTGTPTPTEVRALVPTSVPAASCVEYTPVGASVPASAGLALAEGLYVVRVQNTHDPAYADYSGLIVTNPSANPKPGPATPTRLATARANFPLVVATNDLGQPFAYALGGTTGTQALASVEVAPVTLFGELGGECTNAGCTFRTLERSALGVGSAGETAEPRQGLSAVVRTVPNDTSYVFVLGGVKADGTAVNTVERAQVLKVADAPVLLPPERLAQEGATLPTGTLYYRVSAVLPAEDTRNPGGETLPSDEYPVKPNEALAAVRLTWNCQPRAVKYRVYRTVAVNAPSGSERLLDEVPAPATPCTGSPLPQVTYVDAGAKAPAADGPAPLPNGALGRWVRLAPGLTVERGNTAARLVGDSVYVAGGFCSTVSAQCAAANTTLASVERATFTANSAELGAFAKVGDLTQARQRHSLAVASAATAPGSFTANPQDVWLLAVGGDRGSAGLVTTNVIETGRVQTATGPEQTVTFANTGYSTTATHGGWAEVVANYLFQAGSSGGSGFAFRSGFVCGQGNNQGQCTTAGSFNTAFNDTSVDYQQGGPRYLAGTTLFRAFVYAAGGFPNDAGGTSTSTIERIIY